MMMVVPPLAPLAAAPLAPLAAAQRAQREGQARRHAHSCAGHDVRLAHYIQQRSLKKETQRVRERRDSDSGFGG